MNQVEMVKKFRDFTAVSLDWCAKEAEEGTTRVTGAIDVLLKDLARVSLMSSDSLKSLERLQKLLHTVDKKNYQQLHTSLKALSRENSDIDTYVHPIMEALQFQDRFRQNLENALKMIDIWQEQRIEFDQGSVRHDVLLDFGKSLIAKTTMRRERDVIRKHIAGLGSEQDTPRVSIF